MSNADHTNGDQPNINPSEAAHRPKRSTSRRLLEAVLVVIVVFLLGGNVLLQAAPELSNRVLMLLPDELLAFTGQTFLGQSSPCRVQGGGCCASRAAAVMAEASLVASQSTGCQQASCCSKAACSDVDIALAAECCQQQLDEENDTSLDALVRQLPAIDSDTEVVAVDPQQ